MLTVSLWQVWASLIFWGKEWETRSWPTDYRGLLVIHAALRDKELKALAHELRTAQPNELSNLAYWYKKVAPKEYIDDPMLLPRGAGLGVVRLVDCIPTAKVKVSDQERAFGDYTPGRFAWRLEIVEVFKKPIPAIGRQKLFEWTAGGVTEKPAVMSQLALPLFSGS